MVILVGLSATVGAWAIICSWSSFGSHFGVNGAPCFDSFGVKFLVSFIGLLYGTQTLFGGSVFFIRSTVTISPSRRFLVQRRFFNAAFFAV